VHELRVDEKLSAPYVALLWLVSEEAGANPGDLIGKSCLFTMNRGDGQRRISGVAIAVEHLGHRADHVLAKVVVGPAMATLAYRVGSRMFQDLSVPDIVEDVLAAGLAPYQRAIRRALDREYPKREYCLQFEESDLAFVTRLLAEEGIFYWFDQSGDHEAVVLQDGNGRSPPFTSDGQAVAVLGPGAALAATEALTEFYWAEELRPTALVLRDFDWTRPALDLTATKKGGDAPTPEREVYAYGPPLTLSKYDEGGGRYVADDGRVRARLRWEEEQAARQTGTGVGYVTRFAVGTTFELTDFSPDLDRKYIITGVTHDGAAPEELLSDGSLGGDFARSTDRDAVSRDRYRNRFTCIPADVPYRPARASERRRIPGLQSALVVGPAGEEIYTDLHGRIRVRFPWDRNAKGDETSSCWVRVAQVWSGPGWGFMFVPRIGMEVLVAFMDGDPDRPLVVGCAHNGANPTPYGLPADKTKSTIKTWSSPGGNGFNELRFEDAAGKEEMYLHAQKDMNIDVLNNRTANVDVNETISVGGDRSLDVAGQETISIGKDRNDTVGANETRKVAVNFTETIGANAAINIGSNKTETVSVACAETVGAAKALSIGAAYQVSVGAAMNETVGGLKAEEIGGAKMVNVGAVSAENVGGNKSINAGGSIAETAGKEVSVTAGTGVAVKSGEATAVDAGKDIALKAGENFVVNAGKKGTIEITDELVLKCGDATIILKKNGDITIKGNKINIKGDGDIVIKGSKVAEN
jgi:type VI secretion system secreted protein VgrG